MTVVFIVQNVFYHRREIRTICLNAHYLVLYKNPRAKSQIRYLAHQIFPDNSKYLTKVYEHATREPHSYLLIDLHPETPEQYRVLAIYSPGNKFDSICQFLYKREGKWLRGRNIRNSKEPSNPWPLENTQKLFQGLLQRVPITLSNKFVSQTLTQHEKKFH